MTERASESPQSSSFEEAVSTGRRFEFGSNWASFLEKLDDGRICAAENALASLLGVTSLAGMSFLDAGSGSGLSSLAARRLGAKVTSFDYDPQSVACTMELRRRFFPDEESWIIDTGSLLDGRFVAGLDLYDIVYSWGVVHHTGAMWVALENAISRVANDGTLFLAIYNDQGWKSHFWWFVKLIYNKLPSPLNRAYGYVLGCTVELGNIIKYTLRGRPMAAIRPLLEYRKRRGMSVLHDMLDWMGGFPYEFATYEVLLNYMQSRGFELIRGIPATSLGCHELVFRKRPAKPGLTAG